MKRVLAGVGTLVLVVVGFIVASSLGSSAQEEPTEPTTTTTLADLDDPESFEFEFEFGGDMPEAVEQFLECMEAAGLTLPDASDGVFRFGFGSNDGDLLNALEECGLPGRPSFGEIPDAFGMFGFRFGDVLPFSGEFPEGFPFGNRGEGRREGDPFGFEFHGLVDRDALAECLVELGSFESVEEVRGKLDECLPALPFGGFGFRSDDGFPTTTTTTVP